MANKIEDLNSWEVIQAEKVAGISMMQLESGHSGSTALLVALAWQLAKRLNPNLQFEQYARENKLASVMDELGMAEEESE
ncbi:hypothetical protein [Rhodococcus opacus]|uniref:hypothetical protein n=1 Tax=Rhodococcus opacus TaxID=37919 RepID=UPI00100996AD|nr:hypothetical protein [Rhodococcus opacus]